MTNLSTPIDYFKKEAKKLFKQFKADNAEAKARVLKVLKDPDEITLMRVQHVIAVENGFQKWEGLISASMAVLDFAIQKKKGSVEIAKGEVSAPELTDSQNQDRPLNKPTGTPLGNFLRGPGVLPTPPHLASWADFFDTMTLDEQRRNLDEDALRMGVYRRD